MAEFERVAEGPGFALYRVDVSRDDTVDDIERRLTEQLDRMGARCANGKPYSQCGTLPGCPVAGCYG